MVQDWYIDNDARISLESHIKLVVNTTNWKLSLQQTESFLRIAFLFWVEFVNAKWTKRGTISVNVIKLKGKKKETFPQFKGTVEKSTAP